MTDLLRSRRRASLSLRPLALGMAWLLWGCSGGDEGAVEDKIREGSGGEAQGGRAGSGGASGSGGKTQGSSGGSGQAGTAQGGGASGTGQTGGSSGQGGTGGSSEGGGAGKKGGAGGAATGGAATGGGGQAGEGQGGGDTAGAGSQGTGTGGAGSGGPGPGPGGGKGGGGPTDNPKSDVEMSFTTANIGRDYKAKAEVVAVFDKIGDVLDAQGGPRFIGWQEIGEGDPCGGTCEIDALEGRFKSAAGWDTRLPQGKRPDGGTETVKVPITSKDADGTNPSVRAVFASPGWAGVSPTRFVTVVFYPERNLSMVNTHFIASAWSCGSEPAKRRDYWEKDWQVLKAEVAEEHTKGRNVMVTGDLNRPRAPGKCNPAWDPTTLHADARIVGGVGIDYLFAVPAGGNKFVASKKADGTPKDGDIALGIDGHKAHWVSGRFLSK